MHQINVNLPSTVIVQILDKDNNRYESVRPVDDSGSVDLSGIAPSGLGPYDIRIISMDRDLLYDFTPED